MTSVQEPTLASSSNTPGSLVIKATSLNCLSLPTSLCQSAEPFRHSIDVDLVDTSSNTVHRVATGLTSKDHETNINAWFNIPAPTSFPDNSGNTYVGGDVSLSSLNSLSSVVYRMEIHEHQIGSDSAPLEFKAWSNAFTVQVVGGSSVRFDHPHAA